MVSRGPFFIFCRLRMMAGRHALKVQRLVVGRQMFIRLLVCFLLSVLAFAHAAWTQEPEPTELPKQVVVGMYVNDIQIVDLRTHSYAVDFYLWFRWSDPEINPAAGFELMNMFDPEGHVQSQLYDEPQAQPDGSLYQLYRHQGLFSSKFDVSDYPFDHQLLHVAVEDAEEGTGTLVYVADTQGLVMNPDITLPGYQIGDPRLHIFDKPYPTAFGDLAEPDISSYSRADFIIPIQRPVLSGLLKTFMPVFLIVLAAALSLLLDPTHVEARIGLSITALLTLVAMQFTMQAGLPEVAYLTLLDQIYLLSYLYVIVVIGLIVRGTRTDERGDIRGSAGGSLKLAEAGPRLATGVSTVYIVAILLTLFVNLN